MEAIVILAVAAVWAAVIVPPLLRSRSENRPNSSVTDFRRQLSTLQRSVPTRTMVPMRGMARPLAQAPQQRMGAPDRAAGLHGHAGQIRRPNPYGAPAVRQRAHDDSGTVARAPHRTTHVRRGGQRESIRRRRANVLYMLGITVAVSGFLAAATGSAGLVYLFALSFVALCGYCYKLVQIRNYEADRSYADQNWLHLA